MALLPSSAKEASNVTKVAVVASKIRDTRQDCSLRTLRVHSDQALAFCFTLANSKETWAELSHFENCLYANAIWNGLQPEREFWNALDTPDVLRIRECFGKDVLGTVASVECWPGALPWMKENDAVMSALGDLTQYLRSHKLDKELMSFKKFHVYDPIRQASTPISDGQTLINLEIHRTMAMLFEVRRAKFSDLECIMSRIHVGSCKTVVLGAFQSMMDITKQLKSYSDQFESRKLISILEELPDLTEYLEHFYKVYGHQKDFGQEIYQHDDSNKIKVLNHRKKMSGTCTISRYHNPELTVLVARPQEPREVKNAIMRDLQGRLYAKLDENYQDWPIGVQRVEGVGTGDRRYVFQDEKISGRPNLGTWDGHCYSLHVSMSLETRTVASLGLPQETWVSKLAICRPSSSVDISVPVPLDVGVSLGDPATSLELGFLDRLFLDDEISGRPILEWPLLLIPCIIVPPNSHGSVTKDAPRDLGV
ncbi:MAG: hypothetical protein J3Q66DRAFT_406971 [Benniella sp.]|nr:MAG: hypothetical protein J3Q66DRAFT_406971 [Benniella sp.]